jgi:site-specific recombinase XerD
MPKKRNHGDGALYFVKSQNLWRGVIDVGFWPDGRRRQKTVTAKTQKAARDKLEALKQEMSEFGAPIDKTKTVEAWGREWLDTVCAPTMKPKAFQSYRSAVDVWIVPTLRTKKVATLKPSDVRAVTKAVTDAGRAVSSAQKVYAVMSSMLESAKQEGLIAHNPVERVKAPGTGDGERGALSTEDALKVLQVAAQRLDGTRWWFALLAGMRQGERIGATLDSADLDRHEFTVQWTLAEVHSKHGCGGTCGKKYGGSCPERKLDIPVGMRHKKLEGRLVLVPPKSGRERTFPLIPALEQALTRYIDGDNRPNPHGLIWHNDDGSPITPGQDSDEWRSILLEAGVITPEQALPKGQRPAGTPDTPTTHWARHTTATVLMELGVDTKVIGEIVGHVDTKTTRRYMHVSSAEARKALEALGVHFQGALGQ